MSTQLDQLETAVNAWHTQAKESLEGEAAFLEKMRDSVSDVSVAELTSATRFADLIAESIAELTA